MWRPTFLTLALGVVFAGLVAGAAHPDVLPRAVLVFGLALFARDTLESTGIAMGPRRLTDPVRWTRALHAALYVFALFQIFAWNGPDAIVAQAPMAAGLGALVGVLTAFLPGRGGSGSPLVPHFDLTRPATDSLLGRLVFFAWPVMAAVVIGLNTVLPPSGGWNGIFPLFQMCFLPFLVALYPIGGGFRSNIADHLPRLAGFAAMITSLML